MKHANKVYIVIDMPHRGSFRFEKLRQTVPSNIKMGAESKFIRITKKVGVKTFDTKMECRRSMKRQEKAYCSSVGPEVLSWEPEKFAIQEKNGDITIRWGYRTEFVRTISTKKEDKDFVKKHIRRLREVLTELNLSVVDLAERNMGIKGRRLICIDFGDLSHQKY